MLCVVSATMASDANGATRVAVEEAVLFGKYIYSVSVEVSGSGDASDAVGTHIDHSMPGDGILYSHSLMGTHSIWIKRK